MSARSLLVIVAICAGFAGFGLPVHGQGNSNGNGNSGDKGKPTDPGNSGKQSKPHLSIQWITSEGDAEKALLDTGKAEIDFKSSVDLKNIQVWLTPSLGALTVDPKEFPEILKDTVYMITLTLDKPPDHTLGGTLHLRATDGSSQTYAPPFPLVIKVKGGPGAADDQQEDAVVTSVVNSADWKGGSVTAGQIVSLFGSGIGPKDMAGLQLDSNGRVATYLGDTQVLFNGVAAPLLAALSHQLNTVVPESVAGSSSVDVVVTHGGHVSSTWTLPVSTSDPALFTLDGSGRGQAAALNPDGSLNGPSNPAARGKFITLFGSGFGEWNQLVPDGAVIGSTLPTVQTPVSVTLGGTDAKVLYAGGAPGLVNGVVVVNAEIPAAVTPGDAVSVVVTVGDKSSPANVTVAIK
jgi:uncharacterized protein (TIGR03437 family)